MGKKRIIKQTTEEALKEKEITESAAKGKKEIKGKSLTRGKAFIQSTYNNIIITVTDSDGNVVAWETAGSVGFKGPKKATPFAASKTVESLVRKLAKTGLRELMVFVKGVGSGRESAIRALANQGLDIVSIQDVTPIPHNGCRPRKPRRV
jgi:small subunit ribosomal protein S11